MNVKTRFAPSPTGVLHIGGVRTALFCWLYARRHEGQFLLRVEDTDRERSTESSVEAIVSGLRWLGLDWDEGPYFQMDRLDRYAEVAASLIASNNAYRCYCSTDELAELRARQMEAGEKPRYDGRCRDGSRVRPGIQPVIRFKTPTHGEMVVNDLVRGQVIYQNSELDDLVIMRADGVPTYHFGVVVDDHDMGITHTIRGDDHLNNTPRQLHIYTALDWDTPAYAHLPMILGEDGGRLSKRHGAVNVLEYAEQGYLPEAVLNYLARLGWSHGDQEIFSVQEMVELFSLEAVNASASRFDAEKLAWINQRYIMSTAPDVLAPRLEEQLRRKGLDPSDGPAASDVVQAYRERATTLAELAASCAYLYADFEAPDPGAAKKHLRPVIAPALAELRQQLDTLSDWTPPAVHGAIERVAEEAGLKFGKLGQPLRVAITGAGVSPPIDVTAALVGKARCVARIDQAVAWIEQRAASSKQA